MKAARSGHLQTAQFLVSKGMMEQMMHLLVSCGHWLCIVVYCFPHNIFLAHLVPFTGADFNRHTANNDHTVLSLACSGGHIATVQYFLDQGANPRHVLRVSYIHPSG